MGINENENGNGNANAHDGKFIVFRPEMLPRTAVALTRLSVGISSHMAEQEIQRVNALASTVDIDIDIDINNSTSITNSGGGTFTSTISTQTQTPIHTMYMYSQRQRQQQEELLCSILALLLHSICHNSTCTRLPLCEELLNPKIHAFSALLGAASALQHSPSLPRTSLARGGLHSLVASLLQVRTYVHLYISLYYYISISLYLYIVVISADQCCIAR